MSKTISIVTAVHRPAVSYLPDAYESVLRQELPDGWTWEWLVQEDGDAGAADVLPPDPRISLATNRKGGAAITRNMTLARLSGELIRVLDADDQLLPGALSREVSAFAVHPHIGWTTSRVLDLLPDGSRVSWEHTDPDEGRIVRGSTLAYFRANRFGLPVHPATLCIKTSLLLGLGAWMALPGGEDTGLLLAASVVSDGYFIREPGLLYRKWPGQSTAQPNWSGDAEWETRMCVIENRALSMSENTGDGWV